MSSVKEKYIFFVEWPFFPCWHSPLFHDRSAFSSVFARAIWKARSFWSLLLQRLRERWIDADAIPHPGAFLETESLHKTTYKERKNMQILIKSLNLHRHLLHRPLFGMFIQPLNIAVDKANTWLLWCQDVNMWEDLKILCSHSLYKPCIVSPRPGLLQPLPEQWVRDELPPRRLGMTKLRVALVSSETSRVRETDWWTGSSSWKPSWVTVKPEL